MDPLIKLPRVILASNSPRRKALLKQLYIEPFIIPSDIEEDMTSDVSPKALVMSLAYEKAWDVYEKSQSIKEGIIIAADTVVVYDHQILGKPQNENRARAMLHRLNGQQHQVYTGVAFIDMKTGRKHVVYERTDVYFNNCDDRLIDAYIALAKPFDKAGAYGIQDMGALLVKKIEGDYFNVMGLPLSKVYHILTYVFGYDCFMDNSEGRGSKNHDKIYKGITKRG